MPANRQQPEDKHTLPQTESAPVRHYGQGRFSWKMRLQEKSFSNYFSNSPLIRHAYRQKAVAEIQL